MTDNEIVIPSERSSLSKAILFISFFISFVYFILSCIVFQHFFEQKELALGLVCFALINICGVFSHCIFVVIANVNDYVELKTNNKNEKS